MTRRAISRWQFLVSVIFMLVGAIIFTYATTRTWTTELVLTRARDRMRVYLESKEICPSLDHANDSVNPDAIMECRQALGCVTEAGGMYYWWNDAIPYWGMGTFLFAVGVVVPFYHRRPRRGIWPPA